MYDNSAVIFEAIQDHIFAASAKLKKQVAKREKEKAEAGPDPSETVHDAISNDAPPSPQERAWLASYKKKVRSKGRGPKFNKKRYANDNAYAWRPNLMYGKQKAISSGKRSSIRPDEED